MRRVAPLFVLAVAAAAAGTPAPAGATASYDSCTGFIDAVPVVISSPGRWCVRKPLTSSLTDGKYVMVAAEGVTIDCNGFRIAATGARGARWGVHASDIADTTVRGCTLRGFAAGIALQGHGQLVEDNVLEDNGTGISVWGLGGAPGIVRGNLVRDSDYKGIFAIDAMAVVDNIVDGVGGPTMAEHPLIGIEAAGFDGGAIERNVVRNVNGSAPGRFGINFTGGSSAPVVVRDNIVVGDPTLAPATGIWCNLRTTATGNVISGWETALGSQCTGQDAYNEVLE